MKIQFINQTRRKVPTRQIRSDVKKVLSRFLGRRSGAKKFSSLALVFVSDAESRRLNRRFLKKNRPANVLSFRYNSEAELILAPAFIRRQARAEGRPYFHPVRGPRRWRGSRRRRLASNGVHELRRMVIHGMLHLAGCHHEASPRQAQSFAKLERDFLDHLGIERI